MLHTPVHSLTDREIDAFRRRLSGDLITPDGQRYDEVRAVWNGVIDRRPALIAQCATTDDVVAAAQFARAHELPVAVRGGRHNVAGHATIDDGLVIDLSGLNQVDVDPETRLVRAGGGAKIGELDAATQAHALAVPMGVVSATGIAGLTLGGGYGWLRNMYGLSSDNLVAAQVVTADGRVIEADDDSHPDLMWGLRGGGGNFGIVTAFTFRAYPVGPEVMFTFVFHDGRGDKAAAALRMFRDFCATAPDEVSALAAVGIIPPDEHIFPKELFGTPFVLIGAMYAGDAVEGMRVLAPLQTWAEPLLDFSAVMPYTEAQQMFDPDYPDGLRYYWKSLNLMRFDDNVVDRVVAQARRQPSDLSTTDIWHIGGAMARGTDLDSAFNGRHAAFLLTAEANWEEAADDAANIAWAREMLASLADVSDNSRYVNFAGFQEEGVAMSEDAYGPTYARLATLKKQYDPTNFFRLNSNIKPAD